VSKLSLHLSKSLEAWKDALLNADKAAALVLAGDADLVERAKEEFSVGGTIPATYVGSISALAAADFAPGELLVLLARGLEEGLGMAAVRAVASRGPVIIAVDEGAGATGRVTRLFPQAARLSFADSPAGWRGLFRLCAEMAGDHLVALGRRYPALREAAARRVVYRTAGQNALIGLIFFIPGADMPAMTLNQAKMLLDIAAIYAESLDTERMVELAALVGLGFGFRGLARRLVRSVPGVGWVVKGVTGYTATIGMGLAAIEYFERGAPASTSKLLALADSMRR
jgi:uncharacterized protein (DUF697 family)